VLGASLCDFSAMTDCENIVKQCTSVEVE